MTIDNINKLVKAKGKFYACQVLGLTDTRTIDRWMTLGVPESKRVLVDTALKYEREKNKAGIK